VDDVISGLADKIDIKEKKWKSSYTK
jgi:hypothetical protein